MRIGTLRGVTLAIALTTALLSGRQARANDPFHHTIPTTVEAIDVKTGGPYMAPPIPYGHYAKECALCKIAGLPSGLFHGLGSSMHGNGTGLGDHGHAMGHGHGGADAGCSDCGNGISGGPSWGGKHWGAGKAFRFKGCGLCGGAGCGVCKNGVIASNQSPMTSGQASIVSSGQSDHGCGNRGCKLGWGHRHGVGGGPIWGGNLGCNHGAGSSCDACSGHGQGWGHGNANGNGNGNGGNACNACGGRGCGLCSGGGHGLGLLGKGKGMLHGLLHPHAGKIEYFVGPGGPVPITPGYVPYVITTRSPREFLAFPPFSPDR